MNVPGIPGGKRLGSGPGHQRVGMKVPIEAAKNSRRAILRLAGYLRPFGKRLSLTMVLVVLYTGLGLLDPYLMGVAIDRFIQNGDIPGLTRIALLMLAVILAHHLFQAAAGWMMAKISQDALKTLRQDLFTHLSSLPLSFFDRHPAGELMSRLTNDIDAINQAVSQNVIALMASLLSLAGIIIAMFVLNPWLALSTLLVVPVLLGTTRLIAKYTRQRFRHLQKNLGRLTGVMEEAVSGQRVMTAFQGSNRITDAFREGNQAVRKAGIAANTYALLLMPLTSVLGNFFVIVLAGFGGWLALRNLATVGTIATFISYGRNFVNPLRQLTHIYNGIQAALAGAERVFEIIDTPPETGEAPAAPPLPRLKGDVFFDKVGFGYIDNSPVVREMTLHATPGQTIALVGPTGAGKTTMINLLSRFYEIDAGTIFIDGTDICDIPKPDLRRQLGTVLQDNFLFSGTIMDNIRYGRLNASDRECMAAARAAGADAFIAGLPQGYDTRLLERAVNLSQGQRQMLAIARAILADPAILILDEATSCVDTRTEIHIQRSLRRLTAGRTCFIIAHRLSTVRDADLVAFIQDGRIAEQGTHKELLRRKGLYHHLYQHQYQGIPEGI